MSFSSINAQQTFEAIASVSHPRLFLQKAEEKALINAITSNPDLKTVDLALKKSGNAIISLPVSEHKKIGKRLLHVSREALKRIFALSYLYRTTKEQSILMLQRKNYFSCLLLLTGIPLTFWTLQK